MALAKSNGEETSVLGFMIHGEGIGLRGFGLQSFKNLETIVLARFVFFWSRLAEF